MCVAVVVATWKLLFFYQLPSSNLRFTYNVTHILSTLFHELIKRREKSFFFLSYLCGREVIPQKYRVSLASDALCNTTAENVCKYCFFSKSSSSLPALGLWSPTLIRLSGLGLETHTSVWYRLPFTTIKQWALKSLRWENFPIFCNLPKDNKTTNVRIVNLLFFWLLNNNNVRY